MRTTRRIRTGFCGLSLAWGLTFCLMPVAPVAAKDLGVEGQVYEIIEEDFRVTLMRLFSSHDWSVDIDELKESAENYTKNLPANYLPRTEKTQTRWKDPGIVVTEDIYAPFTDMATGSLFDPGKILLAEKGSYFNPISNLPAPGIERLFIFDGTDPDQMDMARALMKRNLPFLSFMMIAGDVAPLAKEMQRPVFYPTTDFLGKFYVRAVPTLIGFGRGAHQGHVAVTEIHLPTSLDIIQQAWYGLDAADSQGQEMIGPGDVGYAPDSPPPVTDASTGSGSQQTNSTSTEASGPSRSTHN